MDFASLIEHIEKQRDRPARSDDQGRFAAAFSSLDLPFLKPAQCILVAGTNGKGTTAKSMETVLREFHDEVGLFISPHLMKTTERIRSFGADLSEDEFLRAYALVKPAIEKFSMSHFQILVLMMAEIFFGGRVRPPVKHAVIEVGVGGRLDPTNLIPHRYSIITSLGLDHTEILGPDLASIAKEKFAIIEPEGTVIHLPLSAEIRESVRQHLERAANAIEVNIPSFHVDRSKREPVWVIDWIDGPIRLRLKGQRAVQNSSLVLALAREMNLDMKRVANALSQVQWPGRMEGFEVEGKSLYLSGDHNLQGIESLKEILTKFEYEDLWLVIGIGARKPIAEMISAYLELPRARIVLTRTTFRPVALESLEAFSSSVEGIEADPFLALGAALESATPHDLVLASGSLYMVGELRKAILENKFGLPKALDEIGSIL
jgi:dihydrofolate synthase/folylpolyglutamate synthase